MGTCTIMPEQYATGISMTRRTLVMSMSLAVTMGALRAAKTVGS